MASIVGIHDEKMKRIVLELENYISKIQSVTYDLEEKYNEVLLVINEDASLEFNLKYASLKNSYVTTKNNLLNYSNDLTNVIKNYQTLSVNNVDDFNHYDSDMSIE